MTNTIRGTVSEDMSSTGKFLYNTVMSMGDSALAMTMGNFGMGLLGGAAATNATHAAAERGATDGQALLVGLVAGATETLMEKVSIESLFNLKTPGAARGLVYNVLKQAGVEGTEEGLTTIVNTIADGLIMRDKSELETIKRNLMANGASREEAELAAIQVWSKEFALDVAGGMLSGAAFGTFKSGADYIGTNRLQQNRNAPGNNRSVIQTDHREGTSYGEGVYLRDGGQWTGGQNSGGEVSAVEAGTGRNQSRQAQVKSADSGAAAYSDGQKVSTADLGIRGGSTEANIQIVNSGETMMTRAAMNIAQENGLELTLFAGGNLQINNASGKTDSVRGYIEGNRVYVRADHPVYTAEQLMRHEAGHVQIARGEVDPKTVRQRITKTYGIGHTIRLSMLYAAAYEGSGMTGGEIWEEVICDSLGDMNIFQGYNVEEQAGRLLNDVRENIETENQIAREPLAEEKYSRETPPSFVVHKYYNRIIQNIEYQNPTGYTLVGSIPEGGALYEVGFPSGEIYFDNSKILAELQKEKDPLPKEYMQRVPEILKDPIVIVESDKQNTASVFGEVRRNNVPVIVGIMVAKDRSGRNIITKVRTVHTRGHAQSLINDGTILFLNRNKSKTRAWFQASRITMPLGGTKFGLIRTLPLSDDIVKGLNSRNTQKFSRESDMTRIAAIENRGMGTNSTMGGYGMAGSTDEEEHLAFIRQLEEAQVWLEAEELKLEYLRNMERLEEVEREAELDAAFWKGWDR